jgi:hypothetical protein
LNRKSLLHQYVWHRRFREVTTAIFLLAPLIVSAQESGLTPIGFVAQVHGTWTRVRDETELSTGDAIFPNTTVRTKQTTDSFIRIAMFDGTVWTRRCAAQQPCDAGSYAVPTPHELEHGVLSFLTSYFVAKRKVPLIFAASRSASIKGPKDGLLEINNHTISLSQVLEQIPNGSLRLTLSKPTSPPETGIFEDLKWPRQTTMPIGTLSPGLYALDVQDANHHPIGPAAALLLIDAKTYPHAASEFKAAKELAAKWEGVDAASIRSFLVCTLYAIEAETRE